jgi:hypothetical protein
VHECASPPARREIAEGPRCGAVGPRGIFEVSTVVGHYSLLAQQLTLFGVDPV